MIEIKTTISFSTYKAVIDNILENIFEDELFHAEKVGISKRLAIMQAFAPDFNIPDDTDELWNALYSEEADAIFEEIADNKQYRELEMAIDTAIEHRLKVIENGSMSLTDYALSKLVTTLNEKIEKLDITDEGIKAVEEAVGKANSDDFAGNIVDAMLDRGMLSKPNRQTRRANGQTSKSKTTKKSKEPIKLDVEQTKE